MDRVVISLPIRPQLKTSLGMTTGLHVGRTMADFLKCKYVMAVNLMNGFAELNEEKACFISDVKKMGIIPDDMWFDNENKQRLVDNILKMIKQGHIYSEKKAMFKCSCGRVCIEKQFATKYGKLFRMEGANAICNFCNSVCAEVTEELLVLKVPEQLETVSVFPNFLSAEVESMIAKYKGKEIIISKPRSTGCILKINEKEFNLDVEMVWSQLFSCFEEKKLFLIASNHQIYVAVIIGIMAQLSSNQKITFILTPYMNNKSLFQLDEQTLKRRWLYRLFILNSLKWKKKDCNWDKNTYDKLIRIDDDKLEKLYMDIVEECESEIYDLLSYSFQNQNIINRLGRI